MCETWREVGRDEKGGGLRLFLGTLQRGLRQLMVSEVSYSGSAAAPTRNLVI